MIPILKELQNLTEKKRNNKDNKDHINDSMDQKCSEHLLTPSHTLCPTRSVPC